MDVYFMVDLPGPPLGPVKTSVYHVADVCIDINSYM